MIAEWLSPRISSDLSLVSGFLTWIIILGWLWHSGWRVQRRYFIEVTQKPLSRNAIVWGRASSVLSSSSPRRCDPACRR